MKGIWTILWCRRSSVLKRSCVLSPEPCYKLFKEMDHVLSASALSVKQCLPLKCTWLWENELSTQILVEWGKKLKDHRLSIPSSCSLCSSVFYYFPPMKRILECIDDIKKIFLSVGTRKVECHLVSTSGIRELSGEEGRGRKSQLAGDWHPRRPPLRLVSYNLRISGIIFLRENHTAQALAQSACK